MRAAGIVVAGVGAGLLILGAFSSVAGRPVVKDSPYLGWSFPGRVTAALGRASGYIWRVGGLLLAVGLLLQHV